MRLNCAAKSTLLAYPGCMFPAAEGKMSYEEALAKAMGGKAPSLTPATSCGLKSEDPSIASGAAFAKMDNAEAGVSNT